LPLFGSTSFDKIYLISEILTLFYFPLLLVFFLFIFSKSFKFYLAKISFKVAQIKKSKLDKMKCYKRGVNEYNKFLSRLIHFRLDEMKIYSKILSSNFINEHSIDLSFDYQSKLKPIIYFADFTGSDELILHVKRLGIIKEIILFIVTILPWVLLILGHIFPELKGLSK